MEGTEIEYDPDYGIAIINDTDIEADDLREAIKNQAPEIAALRRWATSSQGTNRKKTIFDRDKFVNPSNIFEKFRLAKDAAYTDDIVANVVETTEQLAFKRVVIECVDEDEMDFWRQMADQIDLSERLREAWRELFIVSNVYPAVIFGRKKFRVRGSNRKKERELIAPIGISFLDPLKVIPVGNFLFNQERLVYVADKGESTSFDETLANTNSSDLVVQQLIQGKYEPSRDEAQLIRDITGVSSVEDRLYELNPRNVWRITSTRPSYERFASVRLESVFELLDLKHLLREMDRALILGSTNAIILVKKGTPDRPAKPVEIEMLKGQVQTASRIPIIVGDDRIEIEIITHKGADKILATERYNGLDSRITARLYQILSTGNYSSGTATDDSMKLLKVIASSMEARRDKIRDSFMTHIFNRVYEMNPDLKNEPKMQFYPRRIALDFDPNIATFMQDLRNSGDISRETILAELDIVQEDEAYKRSLEKEKYDEIFSPVNVPFSTPNPVDPADPFGPGSAPNAAPSTPKAAGRGGGGNRNGGGRNPDSNKPNPT